MARVIQTDFPLR